MEILNGSVVDCVKGTANYFYNAGGEPLAVNFSLTIFDLDEINTESMFCEQYHSSKSVHDFGITLYVTPLFQDFRMHGYVHSTWTDERLTMNGSEVNNGKCSSHIWTPDVVFETAKSSQIFGSTYLHITLDKVVNMAQRFALLFL
ncbi:hypothetical protein TNIN_126001 [Trichonephila inaurata madagascariensis]|uniref:Neurotransmitter-gated ion-channel ligand-binding domain-containing protein n=1 Tax=Trichonephila inaurata madagascariensis TaxID=2747483 RepID=A0A8X6Y219_9ARAC|nr:hypothetical protein TNIN_126001 [Trichonephila inaurata madagascariensis]